MVVKFCECVLRILGVQGHSPVLLVYSNILTNIKQVDILLCIMGMKVVCN